MREATFKTGEAARIRPSIHSPYSGRTGVIVDVNLFDTKGPYLVVFDNGLQFRYRAQEIERLAETGGRGVLDTVHRMIQETRQGFSRITHLR